MKARVLEHKLQFKRPAGTSRGVLNHRRVWYLILEKEGRVGVGECAPLPGLSAETIPEVEQAFAALTADPDGFCAQAAQQSIPSSVRFAVETALRDLEQTGTQLLFPSSFTRGDKGIPINGLIWMGAPSFMKEQVRQKLDLGWRCIKLKIGALQFEEELAILKSIRAEYSADDIILRVDANGGFSPDKVLDRMGQLAELDLHSIEQPIAKGQWPQMAQVCKQSPLDIAFDEELIGITAREDKIRLLDTLAPHYLVLKPSLHGGMKGCDEWIELADERGIGWWVTSYLESNLGLSAIAQWVFLKQPHMHQGLGTGQLFTNNMASPLQIRGEKLFFDPGKRFIFPGIF
ncbi:o-succinylbenzoate synthase [Desulfobacter hydrogenophilus]|uniref:O-succinylbenzoate synthase n=1 Tax=Desulfobacter hydrogenophilus TaxID=2291 RepID=A0A328FB10_9BACT|nr:o-succinylbenzoate synthase [Desulfobacter hydrogenophilus]NDY74523.1 o-succinylbenzoate synthase [Desulfobacter hydrogenophilus]QBH13654.1 o-succinylbenzoate synthase [Desulfobacter hydrogenophilus]RAM01841.1 o-succinylbenzoate synthase [Desulfobacter hydrogenophilus]